MAVNGKSRRSYKGSAVPNTLGSQLEANAMTISLPVAMVGWPSDGVPFFVVVEPGTAREEKICVKYNTSTSLIVVNPAATSVWGENVLGRGVDNTTDQVHAVGSVIYPVFTSIEADQANELVSKYANAGSVVYQGAGTPGTFTELAIGTASHVLRVNSGVPQWGQVGSDGIATGAVTSEKILDGTIVLGDLAAALVTYLVPVGTISAYAGDTAPNGWLLCNGTSTTGYTALATLVGATTPDLRGKFPMGKTASSTGSTLLGSGGSNTIAETHLPAHAHSAGTLDAVAVGNHSHTGGTDYAGTHNHTYTQTTVGQRTAFNAADSLDDMVQATVVTDTGNAGSHFHVIPADGGHGHTITGATANKGDGTAYFQPFISVNYIIKY